MHTCSRDIEQKRRFAARLDPSAEEALFAEPVALARPSLLKLAYLRLVRAEEVLIGVRKALAERRPGGGLHLALAGLFVIGLVIHVVTVTFFAGMSPMAARSTGGI